MRLNESVIGSYVSFPTTAETVWFAVKYQSKSVVKVLFQNPWLVLSLNLSKFSIYSLETMTIIGTFHVYFSRQGCYKLNYLVERNDQRLSGNTTTFKFDAWVLVIIPSFHPTILSISYQYKKHSSPSYENVVDCCCKQFCGCFWQPCPQVLKPWYPSSSRSSLSKYFALKDVFLEFVIKGNNGFCTDNVDNVKRPNLLIQF